MGIVCVCLPHLKPFLMSIFPRLLGDVGETDLNLPARQVEHTLDTVREHEVEEVGPHPDPLFDSQTHYRGDLERSEENGHY